MGGGRRERRYDVTMLPKPYSWDLAAGREGCYDGKFLIGVLTTGI
jgi:hypothetical protein